MNQHLFLTSDFHILTWHVDGTDVVGRGERYHFQTREWAQLCADSFNRLELQPYQFITTEGNFSFNGITRFDTISVLKINTGEDVMHFDPQGNVTNINIKPILKLLIKNSSLAKFLKQLWYGENVRN